MRTNELSLLWTGWVHSHGGQVLSQSEAGSLQAQIPSQTVLDVTHVVLMPRFSGALLEVSLRDADLMSDTAQVTLLSSGERL
jgi:hypothetical protein